MSDLDDKLVFTNDEAIEESNEGKAALPDFNPANDYEWTVSPENDDNVRGDKIRVWNGWFRWNARTKADKFSE